MPIEARFGKSSPLVFASSLVVVVALSWGAALVIFLKAMLAQYLIASAWQQSLETGQQLAPWAWADTHPVARLILPSAELYVLDGAHGSALAFGPGWLNESADPAVGTVAIAAHRDTHFEDLDRLQRGDRITLELLDGRRFEYLVEGGRVVDSEQETLLLNPFQPLLKLVTCYPFEAISPGGSLRYVLTASALGEIDSAKAGP